MEPHIGSEGEPEDDLDRRQEEWEVKLMHRRRRQRVCSRLKQNGVTGDWMKKLVTSSYDQCRSQGL